MKPGHLLNLTLVVIACACLSACSADRDKVSFQSGDVVQTFTQGQKALSNFPLPVYPNAAAGGSVSATGDKDESSKFVMLTSPDAPERIQAFYEQQLKAAGWQVASAQLSPQMSKLDCHKGQTEASVLLSRYDNQTSISLAVSNEPQQALQISGKSVSADKLNPPTD